MYRDFIHVSDIAEIHFKVLEKIDKTNKSIVIQVTALRAEIDKLALDLKSLGLISTSRTGAVAMTKGSRIFN